jgi:hypothetical protein
MVPAAPTQPRLGHSGARLVIAKPYSHEREKSQGLVQLVQLNLLVPAGIGTR